MEALELSKGREVQYAAGLALGFFRGMFSIRGARRRFEKALPGRCFCQIYLCAAFSDPESIGNRSVRVLRYY